jgi:hypothetical protein
MLNPLAWEEAHLIDPTPSPQVESCWGDGCTAIVDATERKFCASCQRRRKRDGGSDGHVA